MPKLVLIETISQFKHQYVVEIGDDEPISNAIDHWALHHDTTDFEELSQQHLGEMDITRRVVTMTELKMICKDNEENGILTNNIASIIQRRK
jgi:hypothetical protein